MLYNPELMRMALWSVGRQREKQAFTPPGAGGPPAGGGGGAPPGMDPSAAAAGGGGAPPGMDPSMAAAGGGAGGAPPDVSALIQSSVQQAVQQAMAGGGQPGAPGAPGMGGKVNNKPDPAAQGMDIFQIKKMLTHFFNIQGIPLPPDILDGPNRDPSTGMPVAPGTPGSTSDPAAAAQAQAQGGGGQGGSAISPIQPMQGAFPGAAGGGGGGAPAPGPKAASVGTEYKSAGTTPERTAALANLIKTLRRA